MGPSGGNNDMKSCSSRLRTRALARIERRWMDHLRHEERVMMCMAAAPTSHGWSSAPLRPYMPITLCRVVRRVVVAGPARSTFALAVHAVLYRSARCFRVRRLLRVGGRRAGWRGVRQPPPLVDATSSGMCLRVSHLHDKDDD